VIEQPSTVYRPSLTHLKDARFEDRGWRSFFSYRDLGVKGATDGDFDVRIVRSGPGHHESTGWHFHDLSIQVVYCIGGWELIALEDGSVAKLVPGSCLQIPPGYVHNEIGYAPDMEMFVLSGPADARTVPVDDPPGWDGPAVLGAIDAHTAPGRLLESWHWRDDPTGG
jgi:quercetin dioxygenase-like cupin family protein